MVTAQDIARKETKSEDSGMAVVAVENLHKAFENFTVLNGMTLSVSRGETLAVLGRSGTGKSVLLRIIIGLVQPDGGSVRIHDEEIAARSMDEMGQVRKRMGFLFQHAALYDSLTVGENIAFPLGHHRRDMSASEQDDRIRKLLGEVGMESARNKMPSNISG